MHRAKSGTVDDENAAERRQREGFLRSLLFLDAVMHVSPRLTLRLLAWSDPGLARLMASEYGYAEPSRAGGK